MRFTKSDASILAACILEIKARTQAEVVLVVRPYSGNYRDIHYLVGFTLSLIIVCFMLFVPWEISPFSFPFPMIISFYIGSIISDTFELPRWLTSQKRKEGQVRRAALATFMEKGINHTRQHTGILIFFSGRERRAEIIPDVGALAVLPPKRLAEFQSLLEPVCMRRKPTQKLAEFLRTFGVYLGSELPKINEESELDHQPELDREDES